MPGSPITAQTDLVTFEVFVGGNPQSDSYQILSVEVGREINRVPYAIITVIDGNPSTEDFPASDSSVFIPGAEIEIQAGYHHENITIFQGIILKQSLQIGVDDSPRMLLECRDKAVKMTVGRKNATYQDMKDNDIISSIASGHGLSVSLESTSVTHKELVQYYTTDWDFVVSRADANGQVIYLVDGTLHTQKPDTSQSPVLTITYGSTLLGFESTMDAQNQYSAVSADAWDLSQQSLLTVNAQDPGLTEPGNLNKSTLSSVIGLDTFHLQTIAPVAQDALQAWTNALMLRSSLTKNQGKVRFQGNASPLPGKMLEIQGVGTRFNGNVYISAVKHEIEGGNWITEVGYGLPAQTYTETHPDIPAPLASGLLPGANGLHIGTVKQIQEDPDGQFRVLVNLPLIDASGPGIWARYAGYYATSGAGNFFFPEVNDEVILGFLNNDPAFPVILGSLYSSTKAPAYTPDEANTTKAIVTKAQLKIVFDDKNKVIQLLTPGGHKIVISDQDQSILIQDSNSNKIQMDSGGITLDSQSAVNIKAQTSIALQAGTNITLSTSGGDVKLSGLNINANAEMSLVNKGGLSAELSASGQVTVKGAIVMIN